MIKAEVVFDGDKVIFKENIIEKKDGNVLINDFHCSHYELGDIETIEQAIAYCVKEQSQ
jgi:hypothetical protein